MLEGRTPLATMNRFYSLQTQSRKRNRKNKRTKANVYDESIEPNYPHCISFDSFEQDIQLLTNNCISYPVASMDDDQLSVLTDDKNRSTKTDGTFETSMTKNYCHERVDSGMPQVSQKLKSELFLTTSGKIVTQVKNYPYLFYDPTHPTMMKILKNHLSCN